MEHALMSGALNLLFRRSGREVTLDQIITDCRALSEEVAQLKKENAELRSRLTALEGS